MYYLKIFITVSFCLTFLKSLSQTRESYLKRDSEKVLLQQYSKSTLHSKQLILLGESHFMKKNEMIKKKVLKELISDSIIGGIVLEEGFCTGFLASKIIQNDLKILSNGIFNKKERKLFSFLNQILGDRANSFIVQGVDYEKSPMACLRSITYLSKNISKNKKPKMITNFVKNNYDKVFVSYAKELIDDLIVDYRDNNNEYKAYFKENITLFNRMIISYTSYLKYSGNDFNKCADTNLINTREREITLNMRNVLLEHPNVSFFGQFGSLHIPYKKQEKKYFFRCNLEWKSFVSLLREEDEYKESILSIQIMYKKFGLKFYSSFIGNELYSIKEDFSRCIGRFKLINLNQIEKCNRIVEDKFSGIILLKN